MRLIERYTMKVHPAPKKRNITLRYGTVSPGYNNSTDGDRRDLLLCRQKKLRRLPHIFEKVLELPFRADADVTVEETEDFFRFTVVDTDVEANVQADTVEIHPGVTKVVVRSGDRAGVIGGVLINEFAFELDLWRFRLPASTRPELAVARYLDGDLVVTVPKGGDEQEEVDERETGREVWGESNLVLVQ